MSPFLAIQRQTTKAQHDGLVMLFLGKVDPQDSFILYNGSNLGVGEVSAAAFKQIGVDTWHFMSTSSALHKTTRVALEVATKTHRDAISASFKKPQGSIEPSAFYDADGAAVIEKAREEKQEELENQQMSLFDRPGIAVEEELVQVSDGTSFSKPNQHLG